MEGMNNEIISKEEGEVLLLPRQQEISSPRTVGADETNNSIKHTIIIPHTIPLPLPFARIIHFISPSQGQEEG